MLVVFVPSSFIHGASSLFSLFFRLCRYESHGDTDIQQRSDFSAGLREKQLYLTAGSALHNSLASLPINRE